MKVSPHGGDQTPHTGATKGMANPLFATTRAVLRDLVRHSKYPDVFP